MTQKRSLLCEYIFRAALCNITPDRLRSKASTIEERGSKIARNSVFDCHLSPVGRQMAILNSVSNDFFYLRSSVELIFNCFLSGVNMQTQIYERSDQRLSFLSG